MAGAHCDRPGRASSDPRPLAPIAVLACRAAGLNVEVARRDAVDQTPGRVAHTLTCRDPTSVPSHLVDVYRFVEALDLDKTLVLELKSLAQA